MIVYIRPLWDMECQSSPHKPLVTSVSVATRHECLCPQIRVLWQQHHWQQ